MYICAETFLIMCAPSFLCLCSSYDQRACARFRGNIAHKGPSQLYI